MRRLIDTNWEEMGFLILRSHASRIFLLASSAGGRTVSSRNELRRTFYRGGSSRGRSMFALRAESIGGEEREPHHVRVRQGDGGKHLRHHHPKRQTEQGAELELETIRGGDADRRIFALCRHSWGDGGGPQKRKVVRERRGERMNGKKERKNERAKEGLFTRFGEARDGAAASGRAASK